MGNAYRVRISGHLCSESKDETTLKIEPHRYNQLPPHPRFVEQPKPYRSFQTAPGGSFAYEDIEYRDAVTGHLVKLRIMIDTSNTEIIKEVVDTIKAKVNPV